MLVKKLLLCSCLSFIVCTQIHAESSFDGLGDLPGGQTYSFAYDISADGSIIVGRSGSNNGNEALRWTQNGAMMSIGVTLYSAYGVSTNGNFIVGRTDNSKAFRWTQGGAIEILPELANSSGSTAYAVSDDGKFVVGSTNKNGINKAFLWEESTNTTSNFLDVLNNNPNEHTRAYDISSDGSVIVGSKGAKAFRWKKNQLGLPPIPKLFELPDSISSIAYSVSYDGSVVVGKSRLNTGTDEAFRWENDNIINLGHITDFRHSVAKGVSGNGNVAIGYVSTTGTPEKAFRWTSSTGMQTIPEWLGVNTTGWALKEATATNEDGSIVVGNGVNPDGQSEAWLAKTGSGLIGKTSFNKSIVEASSGMNNSQMIGTILHGSHGHPKSKYSIDSDYSMWATGDFGSEDRYDIDRTFGLGEVGLLHKFNDKLALSLAIGKSWSKSKLSFGGETKVDGHYATLEGDYRLLETTPLYATLTYVVNKSEIDSKRAYENAGTIDYSNINGIDQLSQGVRARFQYRDAKTISNFSFSPFVEYAYIHSKVDGYTEVGGGFPVKYNESTFSSHEGRLGVDIDTTINSKNSIIATFEGVHLFDQNDDGTSGEIIGLNSFHFIGSKYNATWMKASLGHEYTFDNKSKFNTVLNATSKGMEPNYWLSLNYIYAF